MMMLIGVFAEWAGGNPLLPAPRSQLAVAPAGGAAQTFTAAIRVAIIQAHSLH
jgi:hypothetical protein